MASLSIVNFSGRLFDKTMSAKEDGLIADISYGGSSGTTSRSQIVRAQAVSFNDVGDQFVITDTRGCVITYYLKQNRYMWVAKSTNAAETVAFVSNLEANKTPTPQRSNKNIDSKTTKGGQSNNLVSSAQNISGTAFKSENVIVANSDNSVSIYLAKGKQLANLKGHHSKVEKILTNTKQCMIMTQSKDVVILWDRDRLQNLKSFYAKNNPFKDCCFTADGSKICTLFRDSSIYFWNVSDFQITDLPKELQLETIDCSAKHLACGGKTPYLVIFDIETYFVERHLFRKIYKLPAGFERGITKLQFLRRKWLIQDLITSPVDFTLQIL